LKTAGMPSALTNQKPCWMRSLGLSYIKSEKDANLGILLKTPRSLNLRLPHHHLFFTPN
jgi:hypothetical protein